MTPEQLVEQLKTALNDRLISAVLYGSAAAGDYVAGTSNYNVLLVLDRLGLAELDAVAKPALRWAKAGNRPPLLFTPDQLAASANVFPIKLLDMRQSHRVLFGEDPLADVTIEREHLRLQLERELKGHLLALRERYLLAGGNPRRVAELLTSTLSGFSVLFRGAAALSRRRAAAEARVASAAGHPRSFRSAAIGGDRRPKAPAAQTPRSRPAIAL